MLIIKTMEQVIKLNEQEELFCQLYANGDAPFTGNAERCYKEAFQDQSRTSKHKAQKLLARKDIQAYLEELDQPTYEEAKYMKKFLTENLMHIVGECSVAEVFNKKGQVISPAAMRSVAVSASKALMELYPVKEAQISKLKIDGAGEGGITFNVIMPDQTKVEQPLNEE